MQHANFHKLYRWLPLLAFACLCLAGDKKREYLPISRLKYYQQPKEALSALAARDGKTINHFCVVGVRLGKGKFESTAYVYWKENHTITLWDGLDLEQSTHTLLYSIRTWDLDKDVVPADMDFGGTSTIQDKQVDEILSACKRVGQRFVIGRHMEPGFHKF